MTQTDLPTWRLNFQLKLMAALDAAWAILDATDDPAEIRRVRDKAKALGDLAAMARKVALITPTARVKPATPAAIPAAWDSPIEAPQPAASPVAAQAEHARRALERLKGGKRGRL